MVTVLTVPRRSMRSLVRLVLLGKRAHCKAAVVQSWNYAREGQDGLASQPGVTARLHLARRAAVVQEHDCARPDGGQHCIDDCIDTGTKPVSRIRRPVNSRQPKAGRRGDHLFGPDAIRSAHVPHRGSRAGRFDGSVRIEDLTLHYAGFALGQIRVSHSMVSYLVPFRDHSLD
ncbi:hypothetical protein MPL3356_250066 [Mesorhizobium plurifarium]|uniref:Uncharacterized protein n=1 Tax=Mesorhizobium plurifarium TaxID=69974 RepID=A0A090DNL2_MESPL|nr:hypothetical protein MPL3356_250066 [Mesorhizobium plurifarium]